MVYHHTPENEATHLPSKSGALPMPIIQQKRFRIGVFVHRRARSWGFSAYSRDFRDYWDGCNVMEIDARNGTEAKQKAIEYIKARMDLNSSIAPSGIRVY